MTTKITKLNPISSNFSLISTGFEMIYIINRPWISWITSIAMKMTWIIRFSYSVKLRMNQNCIKLDQKCNQIFRFELIQCQILAIKNGIKTNWRDFILDVQFPILEIHQKPDAIQPEKSMNQLPNLTMNKYPIKPSQTKWTKWNNLPNFGENHFGKIVPEITKKKLVDIGLIRSNIHWNFLKKSLIIG